MSILKARLSEKEYLELTIAIGRIIEKDPQKSCGVGFESLVYFTLASENKIFLNKPSIYLREKLGISRTTEWRYRNILRKSGYL